MHGGGFFLLWNFKSLGLLIFFSSNENEFLLKIIFESKKFYFWNLNGRWILISMTSLRKTWLEVWQKKCHLEIKIERKVKTRSRQEFWARPNLMEITKLIEDIRSHLGRSLTYKLVEPKIVEKPDYDSIREFGQSFWIPQC